MTVAAFGIAGSFSAGDLLAVAFFAEALFATTFLAGDGFFVGLVDFFFGCLGAALLGADFARACLFLGGDFLGFFDAAAPDAALFVLLFAMVGISAPFSLADGYLYDNREAKGGPPTRGLGKTVASPLKDGTGGEGHA